jgi:hypothetical protein
MADSEGEMMVDGGKFEFKPDNLSLDSQMDYGD